MFCMRVRTTEYLWVHPIRQSLSFWGLGSSRERGEVGEKGRRGVARRGEGREG